MTDEDFSLLSRNEQLAFANSRLGAERIKYLGMIGEQRFAERQADAEDGKAAPIKHDKNSPDQGFNGRLIMGLGSLIVIVSLFFSSGVGSEYDQVFNLSKGLTKLMIFMAGCQVIIVGAIFEAANTISDRLADRRI